KFLGGIAFRHLLTDELGLSRIEGVVQICQQRSQGKSHEFTPSGEKAILGLYLIIVGLLAGFRTEFCDWRIAAVAAFEELEPQMNEIARLFLQRRLPKLWINSSRRVARR